MSPISLAMGCPEVPEPGAQADREAQCASAWMGETIEVAARVVDSNGNPVAATVQGSDVDTQTDAAGAFSVQLPRGNALLAVTADGFHTEFVAVDTSGTDLDLGDLVVASNVTSQRMRFAGDTMFARRFLDPDGEFDRDEMPVDNPDAVLLVSDPTPGTRDVLQGVAPLLRAADIAVVNFESVVTTDPSTAHEETGIAFFSLPGSLPALVDAGVDYVSLGNNHSYDYLDPGVVSTAAAFEAVGIAHSGTGLDAESAYEPSILPLGDAELAMVSMSGIDGFQYDRPLVATETTGGAADLTNEDRSVIAVLEAGEGGRVPIVQLHTGEEYVERPSSRTVERYALMARAGSPLVIGHHPHVVQGFRTLEDTLIVDSLGNFVFDSERHETMQSMVMYADVEAGFVERAGFFPIYIEDWFPRPMVGAAAARLVRQVGEASIVGGVDIQPSAADVTVAWRESLPVSTRTVELDVVIGEDRTAVLDLRPTLQAYESVGRVHVNAELATVSAGHDLLYYGGFEDIDVDDVVGETTAWTYGSASIPCYCDVHDGAQALCSIRDDGNVDEAVVTLRRRVRVEGFATDSPNRDMGLLLWSSAVNGGPASAVVRYSPTRGSTESDDTVAIEWERGDRDWQMAYSALDFPDVEGEPADAVRVFLRSQPPRRGEGLVRYDDVALVAWDGPGERADGDGRPLPAPNPVDFLRVSGPPGNHIVTLEVVSPGS